MYTSNGFAWNHGTMATDQTTIWLGLAGPGVKARGVDQTTWADQTDVRPTMLALLGLHDSYRVDGRVLIEDLNPRALPPSLRDTPQVRRLGELYTQLLAGEGQFALETLAASTHALTSGTVTHDHTYTTIENKLIMLDNQRDALTDQINRALLGAAFDHQPVPQWRAATLTWRAQVLLAEAHHLATT